MRDLHRDAASTVGAAAQVAGARRDVALTVDTAAQDAGTRRDAASSVDTAPQDDGACRYAASTVGAAEQDPGMLAMLPLVRLLHLASPALPIGAYSYSQGQEWAVEATIVHDAATAKAWIGDLLEHVVARGEAALAWRLLEAAGADWHAFGRWNAWFRASRETAELRAETEQMGGSLAKLAADLDLLDAPALAAVTGAAPITLPAAYALAARGFALPAPAALVAYLWAWLENQVVAAIKLVPLGQVAGQRMLISLGARIPGVVTVAMTLGDDDLSTFAPGLAIASARHETQYTRLFRS